MAHVVLVVNRLASLLNTSLEAAKRLEAAGFETTFVCTANLAERLEAESMTVAVLDHDEQFAVRLADDHRPSLRNPVAIVGWIGRRRKLRAESLASTELVDVIESLSPDLLMINAETHVAMIATRPLGIPTVATTNFFSVFRSTDLPPLSMTMAPPTDPVGRVKVRAAWWWVRLGSILGRVRHRLSPAGLSGLISPVRSDTVDLGDLKQVAAAVGVDLRSCTDRTQWLRPHVYRDVPLISFTAREMELPHRADDRLSYVGPMVSGARIEPELSPEAAARWQQMKDERTALSDRRPLVYCSLGTVWSTDEGFLRRVLEVFDRRRDWNLVLSLGGADRVGMDLGPTPPNALVLDWAPQLEILANADCFITHGGVKSLSEAVHFEVPVVAYSTGFVDQNGNARRVQHHRLGIMGDKDTASVDGIEANLARAMSDPEIRSALTAMRSHFQSYEAAPTGRDEGALVQYVKDCLAKTYTDKNAEES